VGWLTRRQREHERRGERGSTGKLAGDEGEATATVTRASGRRAGRHGSRKPDASRRAERLTPERSFITAIQRVDCSGRRQIPRQQQILEHRALQGIDDLISNVCTPRRESRRGLTVVDGSPEHLPLAARLPSLKTRTGCATQPATERPRAWLASAVQVAVPARPEALPLGRSNHARVVVHPFGS